MKVYYSQLDVDRYFMQRTLKEAINAYNVDEVPIGCIIVANNQVIARGYNQVESLKDCTAHAEVLAITAGCEAWGSKYLTGTTLYVTVEPCFMCAGAIHWSQISRLVFGCRDKKKGFLSRNKDVLPNHLSQHLDITYPVLQEECSALMKDFFHNKRRGL